jgi:hypothetical protein
LSLGNTAAWKQSGKQHWESANERSNRRQLGSKHSTKFVEILGFDKQAAPKSRAAPSARKFLWPVRSRNGAGVNFATGNKMKTSYEDLRDAMCSARMLGVECFHWPEAVAADEIRQLEQEGVRVTPDGRGVGVQWERMSCER